MRTKIILILFILVSLANAKNPYEQFGYDNSEMEAKMENLRQNKFLLINEDTTSEISALLFDFNLTKVSIIARNGYVEEKQIPEEMQLRWSSVDPLAGSFPSKSPYGFVSNNPINRIDPDGRADYYTRDGIHRGNDGKDDNRTMLSQDKPSDAKKDWSYFDNAVDLFVDHDVFLGFASAIDKEAGNTKDKLEALIIGNVTMNIAKQGAGSLRTLEDLVMYKNSVVKGATQENYSAFIDRKNKNETYGIASAINAIGYNNGLLGFLDYSNNSDGWDGIDLVKSNHNNNHRTYIWTLDSKSVLVQYKNKVHGDIDVTKFEFNNKNAEVRATMIHGQTIFQDILTPLGGKFRGTRNRFVP